MKKFGVVADARYGEEGPVDRGRKREFGVVADAF